MHAVLMALGYDVHQRVARVVLGPSPSGFTHLVNLVQLQPSGETYLVDVGFGGCSLRAPIPLARLGEPLLQYPDVHRLIDDGGESLLPAGSLRLQSFQPVKWHEAGRPAEVDSAGFEDGCCWVSQYAFNPAQPFCEKDVAVGSHYVSTFLGPDNWFTNSRLAVLLTEDGKKVLRDDTFVQDRRVHCQDLAALFSSSSKYATAAGTAATAATESRSGPPVVRDEQSCCSPVDWFDLLAAQFGIELGWDHRAAAIAAQLDQSDAATAAEGEQRMQQQQQQQSPPRLIGLSDFLPGARGGGEATKGSNFDSDAASAEPAAKMVAPAKASTEMLGPVSLREVTKQNLEDVMELEVSPRQQQFVAPNAVTLAQAAFGGDDDFSEGGVPWCRAIYAG